MIARFRRRFVLVCMLSVASVLIVILAVVNVMNMRTQAAHADRVLNFLAQNNGTFPTAQPPVKDHRPGEELGPETQFTTRFFTVTFADDGTVAATDVSYVAAIDQQEAETLADRVYTSGKTSGWIGVYRYRVDGSLVIFVDASNEKANVQQLLVASCAITASALLVIFLLMVIFSRIASRPVSESLRKQRQFITDASHELKTPLTIISANAEIIDMNFGENEWSRGIEKQTARMTRLIQNLIELTRIDEGGQKQITTRFNLSDAVYDTAMTFAMPAARKNMTVSVDATPEVYAQGEEAAARQLVAILMDNAIKHAGMPGEIDVRLVRTGKYACLTVVNPCENAAAIQTDHVFDRFYRANGARTGDGSYGIGLSIAKSIVDSMKGRIAASVEGDLFTISVKIHAKM